MECKKAVEEEKSFRRAQGTGWKIEERTDQIAKRRRKERGTDNAG